MAGPRQGQYYEYLVEFLAVGRYVKVSAIDPVTNTEVAMTGPSDYNRDLLARHAIRKLEYVLRKRFGDAVAPKGRGKFV